MVSDLGQFIDSTKKQVTQLRNLRKVSNCLTANLRINIYSFKSLNVIAISLLNSEPTHKKASEMHITEVQKLEEKIYNLLYSSLLMINNRFTPFRNKYSPKVAIIQSNVDYHPGNSQLEDAVETKGYLNCHLCFNAQTQMYHTEPDASYTVIAVPNEIPPIGYNGKRVKAQFEFMIDESNILVLPMHPGLIIMYSGYMLTHRQQILNCEDCSYPFTNIVSYNSKRLFSNLMESFRRDIDMDKKTLSKKK